MKTILLLIPSMAGIGGTERMVDNLSRLFAEAGHKVFQVTFDPPSALRSLSSETTIYQLGPIPRLPLALRFVSYALAALRLARLKRQLKPDITISNLWRSDLISQFSLGFDKKIALCHTNVVDNPTNKLMLRFRAIVAAVYRRFDKVVAVSEPLAQELTALYRLPAHKIGFVNNFIFTKLCGASMHQPTEKHFVWVGRMVPEKNLTGLLHVWARFIRENKEFQLLVIGDGPQQAELHDLANTLQLTAATDSETRSASVVFLGRRNEPLELIRHSYALLLPSLSEGLPIVVLEALSLGVPILAADAAGGGVRAALIGDYDLSAGQLPLPTSCGVLLPIPRSEAEDTIRAWVDWLKTAALDPSRRDSWRSGALKRSERYGPASAYLSWQRIFKSIG
jgi:glycosyltransferase involved in cell wall biosynthesis